MKHKYLFLLGRPGCGKSAFCRRLQEGLAQRAPASTIERVDDFPKLWAKFEQDDALEQQGKPRLYSIPAADGDYSMTNDEVLMVVLDEVNADLVQIDKADHLVVVEFARPNNIQSLLRFDARVLEQALVVYLDVSFETCWQRNVARHAAALAKDGDDHLVPRKEMEEVYLHDDRDALVQYLHTWEIPVVVVDNEPEGKEHLHQQADLLIPMLL